ncbi:MAG: ribonuclease III [Deltaproteobacteria bacterium]|nr:ribonuclease III [Nannocystaceae bacterium]
MSGLPSVLEQLPIATDGDDLQRSGTLEELQARIGHRFARPSLLRVALTLGSWANEHPEQGWPSNACLEFFGDAVLDLLAADALWTRFPSLDEGELTRLRASIVSERCLSEIATTLELGRFLWLGRGDDKLGVRRHRGTLADALEAVLGAVFLDARASGDDPLRVAAQVFTPLFAEMVGMLRPEAGYDPKTRLQHWAQGLHRITPSYVREEISAGEGTPRWRARVELRFGEGRVDVLGEGEGASLREAERAAADAALAVLAVDRDG